jgi:hypothetical protein
MSSAVRRGKMRHIFIGGLLGIHSLFDTLFN